MRPLQLKVATGLEIVSRSHDDRREREREMGRCWCLELGLSHHPAGHRALADSAYQRPGITSDPDSLDVNTAALLSLGFITRIRHGK